MRYNKTTVMENRNSTRENTVVIAMREHLLEDYRLKHGLVTMRPWPAQPQRSVLYRPKDGRWYAAAFHFDVNGRREYVIEIPFDPQLIEMLVMFQYCAKAHYMDPENWLMLVIQDGIDIETYQSLMEMSWEYMKETHPDEPVQNGTVYQDEPIPRRFVQTESVPAPISEMKNLYQMQNPLQSFYRQAVFMADYTDAYAFQGTFMSARPVYHQMTDRQLRGYFSWRTDLRESGILRENTPISFVKLYVYELIHLVHGNIQETLEQLQEMEAACRRGDAFLRLELHQVIHDFEVYYNCGLAAACHLPAGDILIYPEEYEDDQIKDALKQFALAEILSSSFLKDHVEEAVTVIERAFLYLHEAYQKEGKNCFSQLLYFVKQKPYQMFTAAVFYEKEKHPDGEYPLHAGVSMICKDSNWYRRTYSPRNEWQFLIRETDRLLRPVLGYRHSLKVKQGPPVITQAVSAAVKEYLIQLEEEQKPKVEIQMHLLEGIRRDAAVTRDSLLIDEEIEIAEAEILSEPEEETEERESLFTEEEMAVLNCLLEGTDPQPYLKEHHLSIFLLADSVNEKMMDEIGDTVIEFEGERAVLIEDYRQEVSELCGRQE